MTIEAKRKHQFLVIYVLAPNISLDAATQRWRETHERKKESVVHKIMVKCRQGGPDHAHTYDPLHLKITPECI